MQVHTLLPHSVSEGLLDVKRFKAITALGSDMRFKDFDVELDSIIAKAASHGWDELVLFADSHAGALVVSAPEQVSGHKMETVYDWMLDADGKKAPSPLQTHLRSKGFSWCGESRPNRYTLSWF